MKIRRYMESPLATWETGADELVDQIRKFGEDNAKLAVEQAVEDMTFSGLSTSEHFPPTAGVIATTSANEFGCYGVQCGLVDILDAAFDDYYHCDGDVDEFRARLDATEDAIRRIRAKLTD